MSIPVSVIIVTKNEEKHIDHCLQTLKDFDDITIVDSKSTDKTLDIIRTHPHVQLVEFEWNGQYPKKRQWCLNNLTLKHDWVLFIDADEYMTQALSEEIAALPLTSDSNKTVAGYFIPARYIFDGHNLRFGLRNNKLALLHRKKMAFPVIDDLDIAGMGEIEGHYQPVLKSSFTDHNIAQLKNPLYHNAYADKQDWQARHERYASWEEQMNARRAWPQENTVLRRVLKQIFRTIPMRGLCAFLHSYIFKLGFLDGAPGYGFARSRKAYYDLVERSKRKCV